MTTFSINIQSLIELDDNGNPATSTLTVDAETLAEAQASIPPGYVQVGIQTVEIAPVSIRPISGRILVKGLPGDYADSADFAYETLNEILRQAWTLAQDLGFLVIWVEVQFQDPTTGEWEDWDVSGDALEIDFTDRDEPKVRTLTSEEWKQASK